MVVFVSAPYSATSLNARMENAATACKAALAVMQRGHHPVVPHALGACGEWLLAAPSLAYERWMETCLAWLERCDALLFLGSSPGADRELARARELGMPIFESAEELPEDA